MSKAPVGRSYRKGGGVHAAVLVHGIRMSERGMRPFADLVAAAAPDLDVHLFDYDWTRHLALSASYLTNYLHSLPHERISLVGYSMGGLVSRLAATEFADPRLGSIITLATPNRGALTTSQLSAAGQETAGAIRFISPLVRSPGVMDLTIADEIMLECRGRTGVPEAVAPRRYASVPALYFHEGQSWRSNLTGLGPVFGLLDYFRLSRVSRPHDGIVTERSNNVTKQASSEWAEFDYARIRGHAVHFDARKRNHTSVLASQPIAELVARLVTEDDWATLRSPDVRVDIT